MTKGEKIKLVREKSGRTQVELADLIGVSKQTLYKYENDIVTNIPSDKIEAIARVTNTTPAYIMGWENPTTITRILTPDESALLDDYQKLNDLGKDRAREDVSDLTEIPRYTAYVPQTLAAHFDGEEMTESQRAAVERLKAHVKKEE